MVTPPIQLTLHAQSRVLEIQFEGHKPYHLPLEYLRVFSPSAEVRGHGGPIMTVPGKRRVGVTAIEPVGHYAIKLVFDDGHDTGLYTWGLLQELGERMTENWSDYLERLQREGLSRDTA